MTSSQQKGISSDRVVEPVDVKIKHLECPICRELLWKPVACQACETSFCSSCINQWLNGHSKQCPNRCQPYIQRKCPPLMATLLSELKIACIFASNGCAEVISYDALEKHEIDCDFRSSQCPACKAQILQKEFESHKHYCASIELKCEDCSLVYKRGDANEMHSENICLREQLRRLREDYGESKREILELTLQLNEMRLLNPTLNKARITFNDLADAVDGPKLIPQVYNGIKWTGMSYLNKYYVMKKYPQSGYATSFTAGGGSVNVAFFNKDASICMQNPQEKFTIFSVTACGAWRHDLELTIKGHRNMSETHSQTVTLLLGKPHLILLHWKEVDKVIFKTTDGTNNSSVSEARLQVIITQITLDSSTRRQSRTA